MNRDWIWLFIELALTFSWIFGIALIALFLMTFKPARRLYSKITNNHINFF